MDDGIDGLTIEPMHFPGTADAPDAGPFLEMVDLRNDIEAAAMGNRDLAVSGTALLPEYQDKWIDKRVHVARLGSRMVGRVFLELPGEEGARTALIEVEVLPEFRGRGIGSALLELAETMAAEAGRPVNEAYIIHSLGDPTAARVLAATGFGDVPADDPGVRFLLRRRWTLEQVYRVSRLDLAEGAAMLDELAAGAVAASAASYELVSWVGATPAEFLDDLAVLNARMSTDAPQGGLEVDEEIWTADRVADLDARTLRGGYLFLSTAARHRETGRLVAFSNMYVDADRSRPAQQGDSLVLREHRGHRLGLLVKTGLHRLLAPQSPETSLAYTFNAEENRPMLSINEAMGYRPVGYQGVWKNPPGV